MTSPSASQMGILRSNVRMDRFAKGPATGARHSGARLLELRVVQAGPPGSSLPPVTRTLALGPGPLTIWAPQSPLPLVAGEPELPAGRILAVEAAVDEASFMDAAGDTHEIVFGAQSSEVGVLHFAPPVRYACAGSCFWLDAWVRVDDPQWHQRRAACDPGWAVSPQPRSPGSGRAGSHPVRLLGAPTPGTIGSLGRSRGDHGLRGSGRGCHRVDRPHRASGGGIRRRGLAHDPTELRRVRRVAADFTNWGASTLGLASPGDEPYTVAPGFCDSKDPYGYFSAEAQVLTQGELSGGGGCVANGAFLDAGALVGSCAGP